MSQNVNDNKYEVGKEAEDIDNNNVEVDEKSDIDESVNHILIEPIVKIDIDIEGLEVDCSPTLNKSQKHINMKRKQEDEEDIF